MYIPAHFEVNDFELQSQIIKEYPLGVIITATGGGLFTNLSLNATHVPLTLVEEEGKNYLIGHLALKNEQIPELDNSKECLVVFQSCDSYISPSWYPTKKETHKFVPTWNFAAVHVYGKPEIIKETEWLLKMLNQLTDQEEGKRPTNDKWQVSDAPESYTNLLMKNIVGLKIEISSIQSKFKFDQNRAAVDVKGEIEALETEVGGDKGKKMAQFTRDHFPGEI